MKYLQHKRWYRKLSCFYRILKEQSPKYLFDTFPRNNRAYFTRNANNIPHFKAKHSFFKNTHFPSAIIMEVFQEIRFRVILQGIQYFFGPGTPRTSLGDLMIQYNNASMHTIKCQKVFRNVWGKNSF